MRLFPVVFLVVFVAFPSLVSGGVGDHPHPRLWLPSAGEVELRRRIEADPLAAAMQQSLLGAADEVVAARTTRYEIPDGRRLLRESRLALSNISHCAWAWRFTGKEVYRQRVIDEMEAACAMKDWNPSHFLDTAEMALAVGLGYDWLYDSLSPEQRSRFAEALLEKALQPADALYRGNVWWSRPKNNWAQVCGAGIAIAAAVVHEEDPALCSRLLARGVGLINECHGFYEPDGMYPEGPGYWQYGTMYQVKLLAACQVWGIPVEGDQILRKAGNAIIHLQGPSGYSFNFADARASKGLPSAAQCWIASRFQDSAQTTYVRRGLELGLRQDAGGFRPYGGPLSLLWLPRPVESEALPTFAFFGGEQSVATFRTSWGEDAVWFAIKGGLPEVSHGQMDVGTFVYDAKGVRWFHDLGSDNYNLDASFGSKRWEYFRLQNRSHNTLEIAGRLQKSDAVSSPIIRSGSEDGVDFAAFELSPAYSRAARKVVREVRFERSSGVVRLSDEVANPAGEVIWRAFTDAEAEVSGGRVTLSKGGKSISIRQENDSGMWTVEEAAPPSAKEDQNEGFRVLTLRVAARDRVRIALRIDP